MCCSLAVASATDPPPALTRVPLVARTARASTASLLAVSSTYSVVLASNSRRGRTGGVPECRSSGAAVRCCHRQAAARRLWTVDGPVALRVAHTPRGHHPAELFHAAGRLWRCDGMRKRAEAAPARFDGRAACASVTPRAPGVVRETGQVAPPALVGGEAARIDDHVHDVASLQRPRLPTASLVVRGNPGMAGDPWQR